MAKKPQARRAARDSGDGQFVTQKYADNHPATTQKENLPLPGFGDARVWFDTRSHLILSLQEQQNVA